MRILTLFLSILVGFTALPSAATVIRLCGALLSPKKAYRGSIPGFDHVITPKFTRVELEKNRHRMQPGKSEFMLGESGVFRLMIEERKVPGFDQPQIVTVKYIKEGTYKELEMHPELYDPSLSETFTLARKLHVLHKMLKEEGLDHLFEVALPLEVTPNYIVLPFVEGEAVNTITEAHFTRRGVDSKKFKYENESESMGPPTPGLSPLLDTIWQALWQRNQYILRNLKARGYKSEFVTYKKSPDGVRFLEAAWLRNPKYTYEGESFGRKTQVIEEFLLRNDIIITVDGRLVITDPE